MITWNRQRKRTRDRLLQYDFTRIPALPHSAGLPFVYPWETYYNTATLELQLLQLAQQHGYTGSEQEFWQHFISGSVIMGTLQTFPIPGNETCLYLDTQTDILYYFKATTQPVDPDKVALIDAAIVDISIIEGGETTTYLYIPVKAMPMENLIFDCGDASEYYG